MTATMYSTPTCGYCKKAKQYLKELDVKVKEVDISRDPRAAEELNKKTGSMAVPVILLKGATIIGFDKNKINQILGIG